MTARALRERIVTAGSAGALLLGATALAGPALAQEDASAGGGDPSNAEKNAQAQSKRGMESAIYETWKDVLPKVEEEVEPGENADEPMPEPKKDEIGDVEYVAPVTKDPANPTAVMNENNPMVGDQCRAEVNELHAKSYARLNDVSQDVAVQEIQQHYKNLRKRMNNVDELTPGMVLRHVAECEEFCFPRKVFLTTCHVYAVSQAERREIVFFEYDESYVPAEFWKTIESVAEEVTASDAVKLLLVGRASEPGSDDYNVALSHRRTARVIDLLNEHGVSDERITFLTIGEYTPNLDRELLGRYQMAGAAEMIQAENAEDQHDKLNQSVLMVVYEGQTLGGGKEHDHAQEDESDRAAAETGDDRAS